MFGRLIPTGGGDPIPLRKTQLIVGRRSSCDIQLDFPNVSGKHCEMAFVNGYWRLRDLRSQNGVKVNGTRIEEKFVQPGDTISFAKHQFEIEYTPDPTAAPIEEVDPFSISLLEKAGLSDGADSRSRRPTPPPRAQAPKKPPAEMDDDDRALEWMADN